MIHVIILQGASGSGKSTFAKSAFPGALIVSADDHFMVSGKYVFDPSQLGEAHGSCLRAYIYALEAGERDDSIGEGRSTVVVDNTNCSCIEVAPYLAVAQAFHAKVRIVRIMASLEDCLDRAASGPHATPARAIYGQVAQLDNFQPPPWWPEVEKVTPDQE